MRNVRWVVLCVLAITLVGAAPIVAAKDKDKKAAAGAKGGPPPGVTLNACGCYRSDAGGCVCTDKKGKCECAGECEPVGCEEKRQKEMEREMAAEVKRAQEDDKKRRAAEEAGSGTAGEGATGDADKGAAAEPGAGTAKPTKPARKEPREKK
jgi:hypothetical protein